MLTKGNTLLCTAYAQHCLTSLSWAARPPHRSALGRALNDLQMLFQDLPGTTGFIKRHITKWQAEQESPMVEQRKWSWGYSFCLIFRAWDSTGNRAACSLHLNKDPPSHLLSNFPVLIEGQLQSILAEIPKVSHSSVRHCFNLNCPDMVAITPITLRKSRMTFPQNLKKQHVNTYADLKSFYVSSASVRV